MGLELEITTALKAAMLAKDEKTVRSLRAIKAAIILAKTAEGAGGELSKETEMKLLQKLVKQRKDSLDIFRQQNREDLARKEEEEISVIETYLPKAMNEDELSAALSNIIASVNAKGPGDMGKVMAVATKELAGKADGKTISAMVKAMLSSA